jgi:hypothetical protein
MLPISFEEGGAVRFGEHFAVSFQRTLRVPEEGVNPLPPGMGTFPVRRVEEYAGRVSPVWLERGGVFIPVYQREALWLGFRAAEWQPTAVKVGVGGIDAVTGDSWNPTLRSDPQDYLVCPPQLWLDGVNAGEGVVRQFVAAPLGRGLTVEGQLTGVETTGGMQIVVFEPKPGFFPDEPPPPDTVPGVEPGPLPIGVPPSEAMAGDPPLELGIAAGGWMQQKIYPDPYGIEIWDVGRSATLWIHLVNSLQYREITGEEPPPSPVDARAYTEAGLPWFELYDQEADQLAAGEKLRGVRSLGQLEPDEETPAARGTSPRVVKLHPPKPPRSPREHHDQSRAGRDSPPTISVEESMPKKNSPDEAAAAPQDGDFDVADVHACVDMELPPELQGMAVSKAIDERPDNILGPNATPAPITDGLNAFPGPALAVVFKKLWQPGRTLRVRFLDRPPKKVRDKIEQYAHEWEQHANIRFQFGSSQSAEIRITCTPGIGSWSYLGTDALSIPKSRATMNYGWFNVSTPEEEFSRTVLHEFGHALGCIHEHMNPKGDIPWNKEATYRYYMSTQGWTREQVDSQLFARYSMAHTNASAYDKHSIMHYPVPRQLTLDGSEVGWNRTLSTRDKTFIRTQYPS